MSIANALTQEYQRTLQSNPLTTHTTVHTFVQIYCTHYRTDLLYKSLYRPIVQISVQTYCTNLCTDLLYKSLYRPIVYILSTNLLYVHTSLQIHYASNTCTLTRSEELETSSTPVLCRGRSPSAAPSTPSVLLTERTT